MMPNPTIVSCKPHVTMCVIRYLATGEAASFFGVRAAIRPPNPARDIPSPPIDMKKNSPGI